MKKPRQPVTMKEWLDQPPIRHPHGQLEASTRLLGSAWLALFRFTFMPSRRGGQAPAQQPQGSVEGQADV